MITTDKLFAPEWTRVLTEDETQALLRDLNTSIPMLRVAGVVDIILPSGSRIDTHEFNFAPTTSEVPEPKLSKGQVAAFTVLIEAVYRSSRLIADVLREGTLAVNRALAQVVRWPTEDEPEAPAEAFSRRAGDRNEPFGVA